MTDKIQFYGANSPVVAMSKEEFFALAEKRIRDNAGSGFAEWGKALDNNNFGIINEGMWATDGTAIAASSEMYINQVEGEGVSRTDYTITNVNGVSQTLKGVNNNLDAIRNDIAFPPAPDGTKTYDSADGSVVQHPDSATAFAAETATNKVIVSRQDYVFLETWHEKISDKDAVYPLGNVQYGATDYQGISLGVPAGVPQGYSAFGEWDTSTFGNGAIWSTLTDEEKQIFLNDHENNIYVEDGELIQVRYRIRVVEGLGDDWTHTDVQLTQLAYSDILCVSPQGFRIEPENGTDHGNFNTDGQYIGKERRDLTAKDYPNGVFALRDGTSQPTTSFGYNGLCFAIPIALVQRRSSGIYEPTYNPNGCDKLTGNQFWYENPTAITSTADCFNPANKQNAGDISSSNSGRPDDKYYDAIYASDVNDLRMSSRRVPLSQIREGYKRKAIAGEVRGFEGVPFLSSFTTITSGNSGNFTFIAVTDSSDASVGDLITFERNDGTYVNRIVTNVPNANRIDYAGGIDSRSNGIVAIHKPQQHSQANPTWTDIIGDPARIAVTFPNGVEGQWIPVIPAGVNDTYSLNRKSLESPISNTRTLDDGASWVNADLTINTTTNDFTGTLGGNYVALWQYETQAHFTEDDVNSKVLDLGGVFGAARNNNAPIVSSLIGKVPTSAAIKSYLETFMIQATLGATGDGAGSLLGDAWGTSHHTLDMGHDNNSPAVKILDYLSSENGVAKLCYAYKEMVYDTTWGDNNQFEIIDNQSTLTDDNDNTVLYGTASFQTQFFIDSSDGDEVSATPI